MQSGAYLTELVVRCHRFDKKLALSVGLTVEETHCLSQLHLHNPFCIRKLAELLGVSTTRMSRLLLNLERKGLIARRPSPLDRRIEQVSLTGEGRAVVAKLLKFSEASGGEIFSGLPVEEYSPSPGGSDEEFARD